MSKKKKNGKGFTLIELIIVIVILGIIAGVAVPKYIGLAAKARTAAARGVGGSLSGSISSLHSDYLLHQTDYSLNDVISNGTFSGGISAANFDTTTNAGNVILNYQGTDFEWAYTARSGDTQGILTETGTW